MNSSSLLTLGAVAVGGYFLYENFFAAPALPADAVYQGSVAAGQTLTVGNLGSVTGPTNIYHSASTGLYYSSSVAPTAAQSPAATPAAAGAATTPPAITATAPPAAAPVAAASSFCAGTLAAVAGSEDPAFTPSGSDFLGSPYHWQVYWNLQPGAPALNINGMFSDTTTPITGAAFCAAATSYLAAAGLSGLFAGMGFYGGLGQDPGTGELDETFNVTAGPGNTGILTPTGGTSSAPTISGTGTNLPMMLGIGAAVAVALAIAFSGSGRRGTYY